MKKTFNKYYNDELEVLRQLGDEFAKKNPGYASFLETNNQSEDPDVRRLMEAFAFLSGRLRQKLDDELPELTQTLFSLLWPNYLRPLPSTSILQFEINNPLTTKYTIPRNIAVASGKITSKQGKGATCYFKSCYAVDVYPLSISELEYKGGSGYNKSLLTLDFELQNDLTLSKAELLISSLRFFLHGEDYKTYKLYLWLCYFLDSIEITPLDGVVKQGFKLNKKSLVPIGFSEEESIFPYPETAFSGYRLLQEYFSIPEKFLFLDLNDLDKLQQFEETTKFRISFNLDTAFDRSLQLKKENFRLNCTPIINLFEHYAQPVKLDNKKTEYHIYPQGVRDHYEIFEITEVIGKQQGTSKEHPFFKFESFEHSLAFEDFEFSKNQKTTQQAYFKNKLLPRVINAEYGGYNQLQGIDTFISFVNARDSNIQVKGVFRVETVSIDLLCSNGGLAESLAVGDICHLPTKIHADSLPPNFVTFKNITAVKPSVPPPIDTGLHWHLISSLGVNYKALNNVDALKFILSSYDFAAYIDEGRSSRQRIESIRNIETKIVDRLEKRRMLRVNQITMLMSEKGFGENDSEGQLYLFASVLNEFFSLYSGINASHELVVNVESKERDYKWTTIKQNYRK